MPQGVPDWTLEISMPLRFTQMEDTPGDYSGAAGRGVKVDAAETSLIWTDMSPDAHASRHAYGGADVVNNVGCRVSSDAGQTIPNATWTKLQFATVDYDLSNSYDETTNYRFTCPADGVYIVDVHIHTVSVDWSAGRRIQIEVYKNGTPIKEPAFVIIDASVTTPKAAWGSAAILADANDYIEVYVYITRGASTDLSTYAIRNYWWIQKVL